MEEEGEIQEDVPEDVEISEEQQMQEDLDFFCQFPVAKRNDVRMGWNIYKPIV